MADQAGGHRREQARGAARPAKWRVTYAGKIAWPANDNTPPPFGAGKRFLAAAALALGGLLVLGLVAYVL